MGTRMYNDNRDLDLPPKDLSKKTKRIKQVVQIFTQWFEPSRKVTVLDIGTRDGYAVEVLNKRGYTAEGIDLIDVYIKDAQAKGRNVVFGDMMDESTLPNKKYDIIYTRHCIEHCRNGLRFMKSCEKLLKPRGKLFLIFPLESKKMFKNYTQGYHMIYYPDKKSFLKLIKQTNFKTKVCGLVYKFGLPKRKKTELLFIGELK